MSLPIPLSVLDLSPIVEGGTAAQALRNTLDLARHAEALGYRRFWVAEHHNMTGIASAATSVVIGYIAGGTKSIRVGAGGIMLPNHAPLVIAEQFGTLESLYPGRIDLGLGRAPGSDQRTAWALRRDRSDNGDNFPRDVQELQAYFRPAQPGQAVRAVPGAGLDVPLWILGSSTFGARLAAELGLPYAFASHFAPDQLLEALHVYRQYYKPTAANPKPHAMVGVNVFAADTDREAEVLFTSLQDRFVALARGNPGPLRPPQPDVQWSPEERAWADRALRYSVVGGPETVRHGLGAIQQQTGADEIMVTAAIHDHAARRRSFEITAQVAGLAPRLD
ncbi:luciferase-like monooxygenase family protein [Nitrospirillum viridazoti Y2]|uniref:Luciferase-like monooxygenase n=1 Tax=Nitrospirillum amazonense TaxID=28077 RepID=A0A560HQP0_9PROT|nr:LLM class flavin-dependent oxidoreductase [Nitrospirillum amazonense]EGX99861.1 luciferase-like monooxygenase family protein [Nitrospirillum amazonense Y2]TWB48883.1 luciferase family oxidoreductase group 1 [Nitrospirillum amazonense]